MRLVIDGDETVQDPNDQDIRKAVTLIEGKEYAFLILERSEEHCVQVLCDFGAFVLEYIDHGYQYSCADRNLSSDTIISIFEKYLRNDSEWLRDVRWEEKKRPNPFVRLTRECIPNLFAKIGIYSEVGIMIFFALLVPTFLFLVLVITAENKGDLGIAGIFFVLGAALFGFLVRDNRRHKKEFGGK